MWTRYCFLFVITSPPSCFRWLLLVITIHKMMAAEPVIGNASLGLEVPSGPRGGEGEEAETLARCHDLPVELRPVVVPGGGLPTALEVVIRHRNGWITHRNGWITHEERIFFNIFQLLQVSLPEGPYESGPMNVGLPGSSHSQPASERFYLFFTHSQIWGCDSFSWTKSTEHSDTWCFSWQI